MFKPMLTGIYILPHGSHVLQQTRIIFELIQDIIKTNTNVPPPGGHVFQSIGTIFERVQDIIGKNLLTKFYKDRTINVASRVFTRKTAPPPGGHGILTKFHDDWTKDNKCFYQVEDEDWTINVAVRVFTRKKFPPSGGHVFQSTGAIFESHRISLGQISEIIVASRVLTRIKRYNTATLEDTCKQEEFNVTVSNKFQWHKVKEAYWAISRRPSRNGYQQRRFRKMNNKKKKSNCQQQQNKSSKSDRTKRYENAENRSEEAATQNRTNDISITKIMEGKSTRPERPMMKGNRRDTVSYKRSAKCCALAKEEIHPAI
ncbi:hypothetical protein DPMN_049094 [Dreissena polymorpha]|uniref:Uncharacterized protein n=1 Tax=Dreissena polymorpha TaxID=45954 RepID=A0A9D4DEK9_DREPO|nr:hypothetical protein DPMN_049094 [Dreissena polymorpha]